MDALFLESHGLIQKIGECFVQLERNLGHQDAISVEEDIKKKIDTLNAIFDRLEIYVMKENPSRRQGSRLKLNQLKYDSQHLTASLMNFQRKRYSKERERDEREELLKQRFTANSETSINIDHSINQNNSLHNAHRGIDDMLSQGYSVLGSLQDQKGVLKKTRKRMLDFVNTLGLSNTVMRMIEKRGNQDKYILFGGMALVLIIILFIYIYFL